MTHVSTINIHPESGEDILIERRLYDGSHWVSISVGDVNIAIFGKPAINVRESDNVRLVCAEPRITISSETDYSAGNGVSNGSGSI